MIISRGASLLKNVVTRVAARKTLQNVVPSRSSQHLSFFYREMPPQNKKDLLLAELFGGLMWWWILWHLWHDFGHVVGEYDYPDPSVWTDEELGILPED